MKKILSQILTIVVFISFIGTGKAQQHKEERLKTYDTFKLEEVIIPSGFTIDTAGQKIHFVLEKQPLGKEPCEDLDFIVLFDNFSGLSFEMGSIINIHQIYWATNHDSIIFFSTKIYNKLKHIKNPDQIAKYLLSYGERERIGNKAFGFDCLIQDTPGYYRSNNNFIYSYLFKSQCKLSKCKLEYYYRAIGRK